MGNVFGPVRFFVIPPLPEGGGGYSVLPLSVCPSKIFFVAFFSVTVDGRNPQQTKRSHLCTLFRPQTLSYKTIVT